ncbi:MAG: hypothetical protein HC773_32135 [Scytonema sp. CRU_2_7]|nr:hypothetical protein [Scytonema sp. CRU_2_7]
MALSEEPQRQIPTEGNPPAVLAPQRTGSPRPHWLLRRHLALGIAMPTLLNSTGQGGFIQGEKNNNLYINVLR